MGMPFPKSRFTVEEYLTLERASEERHIYLDGRIFDMAGEGDAHGDISASLMGVMFMVAIPTIDCTLQLADVYDRVVFAEE